MVFLIIYCCILIIFVILAIVSSYRTAKTNIKSDIQSIRDANHMTYLEIDDLKTRTQELEECVDLLIERDDKKVNCNKCKNRKVCKKRAVLYFFGRGFELTTTRKNKLCNEYQEEVVDNND
jgi:hypothetical protein